MHKLLFYIVIFVMQKKSQRAIIQFEVNYRSTFPFQSYYSSIYVPSINSSAVPAAVSALLSSRSYSITPQYNVLLLLKDTPWHLHTQEHPHHWIIHLILKPIYNLSWFLVLDYFSVISLGLYDSNCWNGGKRKEYLKAVLANKTSHNCVFCIMI